MIQLHKRLGHPLDRQYILGALHHVLKTRHVEIKAGKETQDISNVQKAADFVKGMYALVWIHVSTVPS